MISSKNVTPAKAGVQKTPKILDSGFRRNDKPRVFRGALMKKLRWLICLGLVAQIYGYGSLLNNPYNQNNQNETGNNPYYQPSKTEVFQNYLQVIGGMLNNLNSFNQNYQPRSYSSQATSRSYYQRPSGSNFSGNSFGR